jgi:hypothetical protein
MTEPNIEKLCYNEARGDGYWWVLPEVSYYAWIADFIAWGPRKGVLEIEVKRTYEDYCADKRKVCDFRTSRMIKRKDGRHAVVGWVGNKKHDIPQVTKYEFLNGAYPCSWRPNYFVYAAPEELALRIAADTERPSRFGVWSIYKARNGSHYVKKLVMTRKLCTIKPEWVQKLEKDMFKRAMNAMDTYFGYRGVPKVERSGLKIAANE